MSEEHVSSEILKKVGRILNLTAEKDFEAFHTKNSYVRELLKKKKSFMELR